MKPLFLLILLGCPAPEEKPEETPAAAAPAEEKTEDAKAEEPPAEEAEDAVEAKKKD